MPVEAHDLDDLVVALAAGEEAALAAVEVAAQTLRAMISRKITPIVTWVPWKPVIMKKVEPNCGAPHGLSQGRTPSMISLVHSNACMPTKVAPKSAVSSMKAAQRTRSRR